MNTAQHVGEGNFSTPSRPVVTRVDFSSSHVVLEIDVEWGRPGPEFGLFPACISPAGAGGTSRPLPVELRSLANETSTDFSTPACYSDRLGGAAMDAKKCFGGYAVFVSSL